jgi:short-subunit dehydrogenase involved in D-alanine esterification of teichoic acids
MSKASSEKHIEALKKKYMGMKDVHKMGNVLITGFNKDGLGEAIKNHLFGFPVVGLTQKQLDVRWEPKKILSALKEYIPALNYGFPTTTLINCAAIMDLSWFEDYDIKRVREIIETNLIGAYNLSQQFVKLTMDVPCRKYIVHIGSMASRVPLNGSAPYCMSKAGLEMMVRCMA